jgi:uncharacterized protein
MSSIKDKLVILESILQNMKEVIIAFSGGVDSTFLASVANDVLGTKAKTITVSLKTQIPKSLKETTKITQEIGINHIILSGEKLQDGWLKNNPKDKCYHCKKELFSRLKQYAENNNFNGRIIDGTTSDELMIHRPGMKALAELGIESPLAKAGLTKKEVRYLAKSRGLPNWDKPSDSCLATRFPIGVEITPEKIEMVNEAEQFIKALGVKKVRVRIHKQLARIEVFEKDFSIIREQAKRINKKLQELGFTFVTMDLKGYQEGSMNLTKEES